MNESKTNDLLASYEKNLTEMASGITIQAIDCWQDFRGQTDDVMKTLQERERQILDLISALIADARASSVAVGIFSENLQKLQDEFRTKLPPPKLNGSGQ